MKQYHDKTKLQLIEEIESLKKRIEELEQSEFKYKHTEQILKANEIKLRNIIEHSSNLFYSHTPEHVLTYLSPQTREFFDCEPEEAKIRWTEFLTKNPNNEIGLNLTEKAIETGKVQPSYKLELVGKKRRKLWVEVNEAPVVEDGKTVAIVGALTDITERKHVEKALKESELRYRRLFEDSPVPLWEEDFSELKKYLDDLKEKGIKDLLKYFDDYPDEVKKCVFKIKVLDVNKATLQLVKANSKEDLLGNLQNFFTEESDVVLKDKIIAFANGATNVEIEAIVKSLIGEEINVHIEFQVPKNENGELDYSHVLLSTSDITERKQAEEKLLKSEYFLSGAQRIAHLGSYELDIATGFWTSSDELDQIFGIDENFNRKVETWSNLLHPEDKEAMLAYLQDVILTAHQNFNREYRIIRFNDNELRWVHGIGELEFDADGNPIKIIGTIQDITERKIAENKLKQSEESYRGLFNNATDAIYIQDREGRFLDVNEGAIRMYGYPREFFIGKTPEPLSAPGKNDLRKVAEHIEKAFKGEPQQFEFWGLRSNGEAFPKIVRLQKGKYFGKEVIIAFAIDITERKKAEARIAGLANILESSLNEIYIIDAVTLNFIQVNKGARKNLGYDNHELEHLTPLDIKPGLNRESFEQLISPLRSGEKNIINFETVHKRKDGSQYPVDVHMQLIQLEDKSVFVAFILDITERKSAEEEIRKLSHSVKQSPAIVTITDTSGTIEYVNPKFEEVTGYTAMEVIGKNPSILKSGETTQEEYEILWKTIKAGGVWKGDFHNKKKNGELYWESATISGIKNSSGEITHFVAIKEDITKRKEAENEIAKLAKFPSENPNPVMRIAKDGRVVYGNKASAPLLKEWDYIEGKPLPPKWNIFTERALDSSQIQQTEVECCSKFYSLVFSPVEESKFVNVYGLDITERKLAENILIESEEKFRNLADNSPNMIFINQGGKVIYANRVAEEVTGYTKEEFYSKDFDFKLLIEEQHFDLTMSNFKAHMEGNEVPPYEYSIITKSGKIINSIISTKLINYGGEKAILGIITNITDRKQAEMALLESEAKWRSLTENSPDHIMLLDKYANILFVNRTVPGQIKEEVIGSPVYNFVPPEYHDIAKEHFKSVLTSGTNESYETMYLSEDGDPQFFSVRIAPVFRGGEIVGMVTSSTNITEQKLAEKRIKESRNRMQSLAERLQMIREEERATIAREIHDDLGQSLTALKMDISWMKNSSEMDAETREVKFNTMLDLTNATIQTVKRIATKLRPGILDDLGLVPAIEWQAAEFQNRYKVQCNLSINKSDVIIKDEISIAVFRIFQETLTNVARHSGASKVDISLNFFDDSKLILEIVDNGVGIDEEQINSPKSLGLFGMRERVNILNGEMEIVGEYEKGTKVKVTIPY